MNLKDMLNQVLSQSGFLKRTAFASSTDPDDIQMVSIANQTVDFIKDFYLWPDLRKTATISVISGQTTYALPSDFDGYIPNSGWSTGDSTSVEMPVPDGRWYMYQYSTFKDGTQVRMRLKGSDIEIANSEDHVGETIQISYISKWLIFASTGSAKEVFDADTDTFLLDDMLLIYGIKAFWANTKQMPTADNFMAAFLLKMNTRIARSKGSRVIGGVQKLSSRSPYYPLYRNS